MSIPAFVPGCYGSGLAYDENNAGCRSCPFAAGCAPLSVETLAALRKSLGITMEERKPRVVRKIEPAKPVMTPSPLAQKLIDKLDNGNYRVIEKLQSGENPFPAIKFMKLACHALMRMTKPLSRPLLTTMLIKAGGFTATEAEGYSSVAFQVLVHIGAVAVSDGAITLRRN